MVDKIARRTPSPARGAPPDDHPFVLAVERLMTHLKGEPKDAIMQSLYTDVRLEYRKMSGIDEVVPDHITEAERAKAALADAPPSRSAQAQREAAVAVPHGDV